MDLISRSVEMPGGPIEVFQPEEFAYLPDDGEVDWAPMAPYWSVLWRSGIALARKVAATPDLPPRILELGCGLALPSIVAARAGSSVLAIDIDPDGVEVARRNADANEVEMEVEVADWNEPESLLVRAPFDLILASDLVYEAGHRERLFELLPKLAPLAWMADPSRPHSAAFREGAFDEDWEIEKTEDAVITIYEIRFG